MGGLSLGIEPNYSRYCRKAAVKATPESTDAWEPALGKLFVPLSSEIGNPEFRQYTANHVVPLRPLTGGKVWEAGEQVGNIILHFLEIQRVEPQRCSTHISEVSISCLLCSSMILSCDNLPMGQAWLQHQMKQIPSSKIVGETWFVISIMLQ